MTTLTCGDHGQVPKGAFYASADFNTLARVHELRHDSTRLETLVADSMVFKDCSPSERPSKDDLLTPAKRLRRFEDLKSVFLKIEQVEKKDVRILLAAAAEVRRLAHIATASYQYLWKFFSI